MSHLVWQDLGPSKQQFLGDVLSGLQSENKSLPCKYLYDERGSQLFEQICNLQEYYLTRAELEIIETFAGEISDTLGSDCVLVEYGSGSSLKTRLLLDHLENPRALIPVDISREHLQQTAVRLNNSFSQLSVHPVCADFTQPFELPAAVSRSKKTTVYFPGSTIGNFGPAEATELLEAIARHIEPDGGLLIGVDLEKSRDILEPAYDDARGITSEFNLNILRHINQELNADFQPDRFRHQAHYNAEQGRVEMHLVSQAEQIVHIDEEEIFFSVGESIHTENSYKYTLKRFGSLADDAGLSVRKIWHDSQKLFSVQYLTLSDSSVAG